MSHLSLNHLSLTKERESLKALHEILGLYCFSDSPAHWKQIHGIQSMSQRRIMRRGTTSDWRGFVRGTEVTLSFEDDNYAGSSSFLLANVLSRFFGLHASTNSFTQLVMTRVAREGEEPVQWPPMAGGRAVL